MTLLFIAYFGIALTALGILTTMILRIGALLGECPDTGRTARSAAITIATGFAAIGLGGVVLAAILLPALMAAPAVGLLSALGLACLALGLGFTQAVATLRGVIAEAHLPQKVEVEGAAI
jgi:hypothetical protein